MSNPINLCYPKKGGHQDRYLFLEVVMAEFLKIAELDEGGIAKVKNIEESLGLHVMAYQRGLDIASLTKEQLQEIRSVEEELGVILIAYQE